jgi:pyridoxamine 5'-phosphate oxidase
MNRDEPTLAELRRAYERGALLESEAAADPLDQFARWFHEARAGDVLEPNAMILATVSPRGRPDARTVLLKDVSVGGFVFYTNYESRKGKDLAACPQVALVFLWTSMERQVRIEGRADRVPAAESDEYFASRPRGSQLGAWASAQSEPVQSREAMEQHLAEVEARFSDQPVPRPAHWGGYRVIPEVVEFWQGRPNRLHDRLRYLRKSDRWTRQRLQP